MTAEELVMLLMKALVAGAVLVIVGAVVSLVIEATLVEPVLPAGSVSRR